jgi:hypothetical protein
MSQYFKQLSQITGTKRRENIYDGHQLLTSTLPFMLFFFSAIIDNMRNNNVTNNKGFPI